MKYADQWWRDQVMALFPFYADTSGPRTPTSKDDICEEVCRREGLSKGFPSWPYVERAVRQLKAAGKLVYFFDWQGWQVPEYEGLRAEAERKRQKKHDDFMLAHDREMLEINRSHRAKVMNDNRWRLAQGLPERELPELYVPKYLHANESLIAKLQAKADGTDNPNEAESFRAKIKQLRAKEMAP